MSGPSAAEVVGLGAVQGLTEFLPVSSSGHLALGQMWLGLEEGNLTVSVMLHAGTLLATILFFRARLLAMTSDTLQALSRKGPWQAEGARDALVVCVASLPIGVLGLSFKDVVERWTTDPTVVAVGFVLTALVLLSTRLAPVPNQDTPSLPATFVVGLAQAVAMAPGVSRSGMTIAALLWFRVNPVRSFELSMLISFPAVTGAFLLELRHVTGGQSQALLLLLGAIVSFGVGLVALKLLRGVVTQGRLFLFALWVLPMAALSLL